MAREGLTSRRRSVAADPAASRAFDGNPVRPDDAFLPLRASPQAIGSLTGSTAYTTSGKDLQQQADGELHAARAAAQAEAVVDSVSGKLTSAFGALTGDQVKQTEGNVRAEKAEWEKAQAKGGILPEGGLETLKGKAETYGHLSLSIFVSSVPAGADTSTNPALARPASSPVTVQSRRRVTLASRRLRGSANRSEILYGHEVQTALRFTLPL